jgi:hypothetical protein
MQDHAIAAFATSVEPLPDGPDAAAAIVAATSLLGGSVSGPAHASLAAWTTQRLERLLAARVTSLGGCGLDDAMLAYVALMVAKAGVTAATPDLEARLDAVRRAGAGDVWLWALAHDVYADESYRRLALGVPLPSLPSPRALAFLRLHQITGDMAWIASALEASAGVPVGPAGSTDVPRLVCELLQPEHAMLPPYELPLRLACHGA